MDEAGENPGHEERRTLGATLAAERERQGLSRADVAQRLHMSPSQIEAIEHGDYEHLPKGTFLRGFVRNYAKVLGVAADSLLDLLADAKPREARPGIVVPTQNIRFDPLGDRFSSPYVKAATLAAVAVSLGFAAMYWAMYVRPRPPAEAMKPEAPAPAPVPVPSPQPAAAQAALPAPAPASTMQAAMQPSTQPAPAKMALDNSTADSTATPAAIPAGAKKLQFHFLGDSWVEVRDARGRVLLQRLNAAGSDAEIAGRPPMQVVVGNAPEVQLTYDGRPFDLETHTNVAVARFTLE